jgi:hypothetical protein
MTKKNSQPADKIHGEQVVEPVVDRQLKMSKKNFFNLKHTTQTVTYGKGTPHVKTKFE